MYLQDVDNVFDLAVGRRASRYGDVYHQNEVEQSTYNFEHRDAEMLFEHFERLRARSASACCGAGLVAARVRLVHEVLAHVQPARRARRDHGDRARGVHRPRARAGARVAQAYYESRERLGFPMLQGGRAVNATLPRRAAHRGAAAEGAAAARGGVRRCARRQPPRRGIRAGRGGFTRLRDAAPARRARARRRRPGAPIARSTRRAAR